MEEAHQYLMWMQRRQMLNPIKDNYSSWEEIAFAQDASRVLGGCMWPPRSYSCSFCQREFRSAQALGGHMNVHRRDRARLKQQSSPHDDDDDNDDNDGDDDVHVVNYGNSSKHDQNTSSPPTKSLESHNYKDHYDHDSKSSITNSNNINLASTTLSISSRVSNLSTQTNLSSNDHLTFASSNYSQNGHEPRRALNAPNSKQKIFEKNSINVSREKLDTTRCLLLGRNEVVNVDTNLFMGFNSVMNSGINSATSSCGDEAISSKRLKSDVSTISFFMKPYCSSSSTERIGHKCSSGSMEDIDLELRLGESPSVN